jgi:hypothetical protein
MYLWRCWCSRALCAALLFLHAQGVHPQRPPRPRGLGPQTLLLDSSGRWSYG